MRTTPALRRVRSLLTATAIAAASTLLFTAGATDLDESRLREVTDRYLFEVSLPRFVDVRADRPHDDQLDWSADACSWSPDEPLGYEFTSSCYRHDFGYRNYQDQDRFTESNRARIDDNFRADMYSTCDGNSTCRNVADLYYFAVREFGGSGVSTTDALEKARVTARTDPSGQVTAWTAVSRDGTTVEFPAEG